jgi:hypothetical protein
MPGAQRWRNNWRAVAPAASARAELSGSRARRRELRHSIGRLPAGAPVVVSARGPAARRRCRRFAASAGIAIEREYLAFPSASAPAFLVEDAPASVELFARTALAVPPGTPFPALAEVGAGVLRRLGPRRLTRLAAPGRLAVGRRT